MIRLEYLPNQKGIKHCYNVEEVYQSYVINNDSNTAHMYVNTLNVILIVNLNLIWKLERSVFVSKHMCIPEIFDFTLKGHKKVMTKLETSLKFDPYEKQYISTTVANSNQITNTPRV